MDSNQPVDQSESIHSINQSESEDSISNPSNPTNPFISFPTDYVHCLLTYHCTEKSEDFKKTITKDDDLKSWKISQSEFLKNYTNECFTNENTKNIVVVFHGFDLKINDFFKESCFLRNCNIDSIEKILSKCDEEKTNVPICNSFTVYSYLKTNQAIKMCLKIIKTILCHLLVMGWELG